MLRSITTWRCKSNWMRWPLNSASLLMCGILDSFICLIRNDSFGKPGSGPSSISPRMPITIMACLLVIQFYFCAINSVDFCSPKRSRFNASILSWLWAAWYIHLCLHCKFSAMLPWFIQNLMFGSNYFDIKPVGSVKAEIASVLSLGSS